MPNCSMFRGIIIWVLSKIRSFRGAECCVSCAAFNRRRMRTYSTGGSMVISKERHHFDSWANIMAKSRAC